MELNDFVKFSINFIKFSINFIKFSINFINYLINMIKITFTNRLKLNSNIYCKYE